MMRRVESEEEAAMSRAYDDGFWGRPPTERRKNGYPSIACWHRYRQGQEDMRVVAAEARRAS